MASFDKCALSLRYQTIHTQKPLKKNGKTIGWPCHPQQGRCSLRAVWPWVRTNRPSCWAKASSKASTGCTHRLTHPSKRARALAGVKKLKATTQWDNSLGDGAPSRGWTDVLQQLMWALLPFGGGFWLDSFGGLILEGLFVVVFFVYSVVGFFCGRRVSESAPLQ